MDDTVKGYIRSTSTQLKAMKEGPDVVIGKIVIEFPMTRGNLETYLEYVKAQNEPVEVTVRKLQESLAL